jgi:SHS2 domain-containing protein
LAKKPYQRIDTTADVGLTSFGLSLQEVYINMAKGLFSLITALPYIKKKVCQKVEVQAGSREDLLVAWLNELIFIRETKDLLFRHFNIIDLHENRLEALCYGEPIDLNRHILKLEVKAATYHRLSIWQDSSGFWHAKVILDV